LKHTALDRLQVRLNVILFIMEIVQGTVIKIQNTYTCKNIKDNNSNDGG